MSGGIRLNYKVYLEGVLVPFDQGSVICPRNGPCQAQIQLAPTPAISRILPKTLVHVFYWDQTDQKYHLLFEGETTSKGRNKTERMNATYIVAEGISNYWYRAYLYMLNEAGGLTYGDIFSARGSGSDVSYLAAERTTDIASLLDDQIEKSFKKIFSRVPTINDYYQNVEDRLQLVSRIKVIPDGNILEYFKANIHFRRVYEALVKSRVSEAAPIMSLVKGLMDFLHYDFVEQNSPSSLSNQMIFKPAPYFCPVPQCNIIFPSRFQSLRYHRDWFSEPTRLLLRTNQSDTGQEIKGLTRYAPAELQDKIDSIMKSQGQDTHSAEAFNSLKDIHTGRSFLTEEEKIKGIVPDYASLTTSEWIASSAKEGGARGDEWLRNLLDYKFFTRKFQHRLATIGDSPDFWPVCGFPMAVLDEAGPLFGILEEKTISFNTRSSSTSLTMGYWMDPADQEVPGGLAFPKLPPWFNEQYATGAAYSELLGSPSLGGSAEESATLLNELLDQFQASSDPLQFALSVNRREVISESDFFGAVGAGGNGGGGADATVYSGGCFRADHQGPIQNHINFLGGKRGFLGY